MKKYITVPTYTHDIIGEIKRKDEAELVLAREELNRFFKEGNSEIDRYYQEHPEYLEYDNKIKKMPPRSRLGGIDNAMCKAMYASIDKISPEWFVDGAIAKEKVTIHPTRAQHKIKSLGKMFGADLVGTGPLRQEWVYSHSGRSHGNREGYQTIGEAIDLSHHQHAIVLGFRMDYELIQGAPEFPGMLAAAKEYARGAWASVLIAEYIRRLGYSARAHHLSNYKVLAVPIAVDCGIGELSRAGVLLTKECGLAIRLVVITTEMPLSHDMPIDIGVQSFCNQCNICAKNCPVKAISKTEKVAYNGIMKWKINEEKCFRYWYAKGSDCGICLASCPWTKPVHWLHKGMAEMASIKGAHQKMMAKAETLIKGKYKNASPPDYLEAAPDLSSTNQ